MAATTYTWNTIASTQTDGDSPLDETLMEAIRQNLISLEEWMGDGFAQAKDHDHDGVNSAVVSGSNVGLTTFAYMTKRSYSAGDDVIISNDAASTSSSTASSYTKHKEIRLSDLVKATPTFRIKFTLATENINSTAYGKIYKNGSPVGTERSTTSTSGVTYSEDIVFAAGDLVQVYAYASQAITDRQAVISNFRICAVDDNTDLLHRVTLATI